LLTCILAQANQKEAIKQPMATPTPPIVIISSGWLIALYPQYIEVIKDPKHKKEVRN
jgi:hypothetical protein